MTDIIVTVEPGPVSVVTVAGAKGDPGADGVTDYGALTGLPTLGTAAATASTDYATAAQGILAGSAVQPGDNATSLGSGTATDGYVLTADGAGGTGWEALDAASGIHAATQKVTPADADEFGVVDSADNWMLKKLSLINLKAAIAIYLSISIKNNSLFFGENSAPTSTGQYNLSLGRASSNLLTSGQYNVAIGDSALRYNTTGSYNIAIGPNSVSGTTPSYNVGIGNQALSANNFRYNIAIGSYALKDNNNYGNTAIGYESGHYHANGSTVLANAQYSVYIGYGARGKDNSDNNSVVIGGNTPIGLGANTTVIGTSATTLTRFYGDIGFGVDAPSAKAHIVKTAEQLRIGYDATYYTSFTVNSAGALTQTAIGGQIFVGGNGVTSKIVLQGTSANGTSTANALEIKVGNNGGTTAMSVRNDGSINISGVIENTTSGEGIVLKSPDGTRYKITVANGGTLSITAA